MEPESFAFASSLKLQHLERLGSIEGTQIGQPAAAAGTQQRMKQRHELLRGNSTEMKMKMFADFLSARQAGNDPAMTFG